MNKSSIESPALGWFNGSDTISKSSKEQTKSLHQLLRNRYVAAIFSYQMLSALGSQLVIHLFFVQAAARFVSVEELTTFIGTFQGVRNIIKSTWSPVRPYEKLCFARSKFSTMSKHAQGG